MKHYICVDGGGTKTKFALYDEHGILLDSITLPNCHIFQNTEQKVNEILNEGINYLINNQVIDENDLVLSLGLGGYGSVYTKQKINHIVKSVANERFPYYITNDAEIALLGAHDGEPGALLIAGTGSICLYFDGENIIRSGGWGYLFGDEGSAFWIGQKLLNTYTKEADNLEPKSEVYRFFIESYALSNPHDIVDKFYTGEANMRTHIASLAKNVADLANNGEQKCIAILEEAGIELSNLCNHSLHNMQEVNLALYGGIWNSRSMVLEPFMENLDSHIHICHPKGDACRGAFQFAKNKLAGRLNYE